MNFETKLRSFISTTTAIVVLTLIYLDLIELICFGFIIGFLWDAKSLSQKINLPIITFYLVTVFAFVVMLHRLWYIDSNKVLLIGFISQTSDVYQFICGRVIGSNHIGWI